MDVANELLVAGVPAGYGVLIGLPQIVEGKPLSDWRVRLELASIALILCRCRLLALCRVVFKPIEGFATEY